MQDASMTEVVTGMDTSAAAGRMTIAGAGAAFSYLTLNDLVAIATLGYVIMQIGLLVPKYYRLYQAWRGQKPSRTSAG